MATRLRVKRAKKKTDLASEHKKNPSLRPHKIDQARSRKMKKRKLNRAR
jgi:hypothetical protein